MAVSGTINVSASFLDTYSDDYNESEKKLSLSSAKVISTGSVAIITGTVGTVSRTFFPFTGSMDGYRNAAGELASITSVTGIALSSDNKVAATEEFSGTTRIASQNNEVSVTRFENTLSNRVSVVGIGGTANFSLIIYGT
jgi:hypothetical protein